MAIYSQVLASSDTMNLGAKEPAARSAPPTTPITAAVRTTRFTIMVGLCELAHLAPADTVWVEMPYSLVCSMAAADNPHPLDVVHELVAGRCDRRCLTALRAILEGIPCSRR